MGCLVFVSHVGRSKMATEPCYTLISSPSDSSEIPNEVELRKQLSDGDVRDKTAALKRIIQLMLNGERFPSLLMPVIQYVMPQRDHTLKKLLLIFWEIVPKTTPDGKLLHEMILVCDAYRKDLQHPNEFIRGSTLRFLCKLKEPELLEPLMPAIRACLENRHAYVRRNAVLAIFTIYKNFEQLIPDAPELIQGYLENEQDPSCKRNAFMMLIHVDQERALDYLSSCIDQVNSFNEILQLVIVELVYKVCFDNPSQRSRFIRCVYNLLNSTSNAVRYDAAGVLVTLSSAPTAVKAAAVCYIELVVKESDNNIKLIVLDRLFSLKENPAQEKILQDLVMDILRVLSSTDLEVRKKALKLVSELVTSRTVDEVVLVLKKELSNTENAEDSETVDVSGYRQLLVQTLHQCSVKFSSVAPSVVPVLMDFLSDKDEVAACDILTFTREAVQRYPALQPLVVARLLEVFGQIKAPEIHRGALWILGEYANSVEDISRVMQVVKSAIGEIPIVDAELRKAAGENPEENGEVMSSPTPSFTVRVTADGTYATESALNTTTTTTAKEERVPPIRGYLLDGKFFMGAALASTLTKLVFRYIQLVAEEQTRNMFAAEVMLMISSIIHLGRSGIPKEPITFDDFERMSVCVRSLAERQPVMSEVLSKGSRQALVAMLKTTTGADSKEEKRSKVKVEADAVINFRQLAVGADEQGENKLEASLLQATGNVQQQKGEEVFDSKLNKVIQLTGFSDPVYAEAYVIVNQYDIALDVLVVNQTSDTLQGLTLELATLGDLRLVEKPTPTVLGPHGFENIKATIKISSTENGIIFGNIVYDIAGASGDRNCVVLNNIHIDIMDYIYPASCTDEEFRKMWVEFEWENKITVTTNITDLDEYLAHLVKSTNMRCLTPEEALTGECGFLAANLYARSIFGEDALANLSIERLPGSAEGTPVTGHIRIRAKSQGMALSLGDKINVSQKSQAKS